MKLQNTSTGHIFEVGDSVANSYLQHKHIVEFKEVKIEKKVEEVKVEVKSEVTVDTSKKTKKTTKK